VEESNPQDTMPAPVFDAGCPPLSGTFLGLARREKDSNLADGLCRNRLAIDLHHLMLTLPRSGGPSHDGSVLRYRSSEDDELTRVTMATTVEHAAASANRFNSRHSRRPSRRSNVTC
jgi:hypothetical protein